MKHFQGNIENWAIVYWPEKAYYVVVGLQNGEFIRTSAIITWRQEELYVETKNSLFLLKGAPDHAGAQKAFNARYGS